MLQSDSLINLNHKDASNMLTTHVNVWLTVCQTMLNTLADIRIRLINYNYTKYFFKRCFKNNWVSP